MDLIYQENDSLVKDFFNDPLCKRLIEEATGFSDADPASRNVEYERGQAELIAGIIGIPEESICVTACRVLGKIRGISLKTAEKIYYFDDELQSVCEQCECPAEYDSELCLCPYCEEKSQ